MAVVGQFNPQYGTVPNTTALQGLQGTYPQPGGPTPMPRSQQQPDLRTQLAQDLANSNQQLGGAQRSLGLSPVTATFQERGIKVGNKIVAAKELQDSLTAQQQAIKYFSQNSGFVDQLSQQISEQLLNERFNKIRLELLRKGQEFEAKLTQSKADDAQRRAMAANLGAIAGAIAGGMIGGPMGASMGASAGAKIGTGVAAV